ncbi:LANO_0H11892g1_1 [Lachancea nothofagi CBS 11611]|uniref:LANO_0H11892g1_1 n=1 Tax=Lachancea nothofagi CBS 11611 TaxID=1266666 RepID=A0A1G4KMJ2_9SACH|nr:LANO_0H11892g1_1 [Lachancea nothofagi CBS 11611]
MDLEYLDEGFEPRMVKVARLRRILVENDVEFANGLKKAELCQLFEKHIRPKRAQLLRKSESKAGKDEIERATPTDSSLSLDVSSSEENSAFSNVNDFQKPAKATKKTSRKRKVEEAEEGSGESSRSEAPKLKKRGKKRATTPAQQVEGSSSKPVAGSPLVEKVRTKSPLKSSPHKSLVIDKFESSSSSSSSSPGRPSSSKADILDFSLKRRTASPDFSKLKVSPEFAQQLAQASSSAPHDTPVKNRKFDTTKSPAEASFQDLPSFSGAQGDAKEKKPEKKSSVSSTPSKTPSSSEASSPEADTKSSKPQETISKVETITAEEEASESDQDEIKEASVSVDDETIESSEAEDNDESIVLDDLERDVSHPHISTPELATEDDVKEMEKEVEGQSTVQDTIKSAQTVKKSRKWAKKLAIGMWKIILNLMIMIPILFGLWYREERIQIGYCGYEINLPTFENPNNLPWLSRAEEFLDQQKPKCLACPENAICYPYMKIKCKPDYVVSKSKWSLQGLFPVSDYCAKDSRREKLIAEVINKSLELLRTKNGNVKCGEGSDDFESGITEEDLYRIFYESRAPSINSEEFEELWSQVVEDLKSEPEITWRQSQNVEFDPTENSNYVVETNDVPEQEEYLHHHNKNGVFRSASKKYIGLRCKFEREVYQTYQRFKYVIWAVLSLVIAVNTITRKLRMYFKRQEEIEQLTRQVIAKLQKSARDAQESSSPAYLSTVQLRDVLLSDIVDLKLKNKMWSLVVKKLENNNTNVKSRLMELHGEIMKCWEWVGPLQD